MISLKNNLKIKIKQKIIFIFAILLFTCFPVIYANSFLNNLKLPAGFQINEYASVPGARHMALGDNNIVFVGTKNRKVYALIPNANNATAQSVITIADHLNNPNGVAYHQGNLYIAETTRILKYPQAIQHLNDLSKPIIIYDQLPTQPDHQYRVIHFSPDGWLYISIGMPCNTCNYRNTNPLFGTIVRMQPDGRQEQIFAKGIRNSMGFNWQPGTNILWFTDNGQDYLGDNIPPDEIDRAPAQGLDFGFPYVYGNNIPTPQYLKFPAAMNNFVVPSYNLPAHVAPLGLIFYTGKQFPKKYQHQIFIAEHGSWNRNQKIGYQVITAYVKNNKIDRVEPFITGWLSNQTQKVTGRPVDLITMPDGSMLVSDDYAGKIYRITYHAPPSSKT